MLVEVQKAGRFDLYAGSYGVESEGCYLRLMTGWFSGGGPEALEVNLTWDKMFGDDPKNWLFQEACGSYYKNPELYNQPYGGGII